MRRAVTCLGHRDRGDDALGPLVADRLTERGVPTIDCREEPTRLLNAIAGLEMLVVVDAIRGGAGSGSLTRFELGTGRLPRELDLATTHAFGIGEVIELARALGRAPERVVVHGAEGVRFGLGDEPSPGVLAAVEPLVEQVLADLQAP